MKVNTLMKVLVCAFALIVALILTMFTLLRSPDNPELGKQEDLYSQYRNEADNLFRQEKYDQAKEKYEDALQQKPGDSYVAEQIKTCAQRMNEAEAERLYANYIDEADAFFNQGNFTAAKNKYEAALAQKPGDRYAASRIKACEDGRAEQAKQTEQERQYANLIDTADGLFRRSEYLTAKAKYQQALDYKRDDKYATQQIRECDRLAAKAEEEKKKEAVPPGMAPIPAGSFSMGSDESDDEKPVHEVYVDAFYMDINEVTVARYQQFLNATNHRTPENWTEQLPNHPVVNVSWDDAAAFCEWLSRQRGKTVRLPTEAEWEYAARGGYTGFGGKPQYKYPWGDDVPDGRANFGNSWSSVWAEGPGKYLKNVGSYSANGYDLFDMAGNVWEWCADWYDDKYYENFRNSRARNPKGPNTGTLRVLRGGSWLNRCSQLTVRLSPQVRSDRLVQLLWFSLCSGRSLIFEFFLRFLSFYFPAQRVANFFEKWHIPTPFSR